jgi:uncharacterized damage-inducible protein DinB
MTQFANPAGGSGDAAQAYTRALLDLLGEREPLDVLGELPGWLEAHVATLEDAELRRPEAPGKWSVLQVAAHLLDAEIVHSHRTRQIAAGKDPVIEPYDQDAWERAFDYADADLGVTLHALSALRMANLRHWSRLTPEQLERAGLHKERGRETAAHYLKLAAGHDLVHRRQVARILAAR